MLSAKDITTTIGQRKILDGVSFDAAPGCVTAIVGPNGSGKSTLLKTLTGDLAYEGTVTLNGLNIQALPAWKLAAMRAVLPQASTLAFPFPVMDVVRIGLQQGTSAQTRRIASDALAMVGLSHYADTAYQMLSGGEQQRVQLARVLAQVWNPVQDGGPRWLMLDEPVASLDIGHQLEVMEIARAFARRGGGVVVVMHDLNLTAMFADSVLMMKGGRILAQGDPAAVLSNHNLSKAYGCRVRVNETPPQSAVFVLPHMATPAPGCKPAS